MKSDYNCLFPPFTLPFDYFQANIFRCSIVKIHLQIILPFSDDLGAKNHYYSFVTGQLFCWEVKPELLKTLFLLGDTNSLTTCLIPSIPARYGLLTYHLSRIFVRNKNIFLLCSWIYCRINCQKSLLNHAPFRLGKLLKKCISITK